MDDVTKSPSNGDSFHLNGSSEKEVNMDATNKDEINGNGKKCIQLKDSVSIDLHMDVVTPTALLEEDDEFYDCLPPSEDLNATDKVSDGAQFNKSPAEDPPDEGNVTTPNAPCSGDQHAVSVTHHRSFNCNAGVTIAPIDCYNSLSKVSLKSFHGNYVRIGPSGVLVANSLEVGSWEHLNIEYLDGNTVAIKSDHGKYAGVTHGRTVVANREKIGPWEKFQIDAQGDGIITLKTYENKYICSEKDGTIVADSQRIGKCEKFVVDGCNCEGVQLHLSQALHSLFHMGTDDMKTDKEFHWNLLTKISLRTYYGKFLRVEPSGIFIADSLEVGSWEELNIEYLGENTIAIKSDHGKYTGVNQSRNLIANREKIGPWERFYIDEQGDGKIALKCRDGKYVCAEKDGTIVANSQRIGKCQTFVVETCYVEENPS